MRILIKSPLRALAATASAVVAGAAAMWTPLASADSISPVSFSADLGIGESVTITKTVTITDAPTAALLDVVFLFDTTGSMGGVINNAKAAATSIITGLGSFGNVATAAGYYNDPSFDGVVTNLTTTAATTIATINTFGAGTPGGSGGDFSEQTYAGIVDAVNTASWRAGSNRFIVVLGDATTKTPPNAAATIAALTGADVGVIGLSYGAGFSSDITAIGGTVFTGATSPATIVSSILAGVSAGFETYSTVTVSDLGAGAPEIGVSVVCTSADVGTCSGATATGAYDRSVDRTFTFDVTFTRLAAGDTTFDTHALVDRGIVATERDTFGGGATPVPEAGTLALLAVGLLALGHNARRRAQR